jgi:hypothetical protein
MLTEGQKLAQEFGDTLTDPVKRALAFRIDQMINLAVSEERHRCHDLARAGFIDAIGGILKVEQVRKPRLRSGVDTRKRTL